MVRLVDTEPLMCSDDYKDRFIAEYVQTKIRYEKLKQLNNQIEASYHAGVNNVEEPEHDCPFELLRRQQHVMDEYLHVLEVRAIIEHIDLVEEISKLED